MSANPLVEGLPRLSTHRGDAKAREFDTRREMTLVASDADELAEQIRDWNVELKQLRPGAFQSTQAIIPFGSLLITRGEYSRGLLMRCTSPRDCFTINRPAVGSAPLLIRGHALGPHECFLSGAAGEAETVSSGVLRPTSLSVRIETLRANAAWLDEYTLAPRRGTRVHRPGEAWIASFLHAVSWLIDAIRQYPDASARPDVQNSIVDAVLARIDALNLAQSPLSDDRQMRTARRLAVQRAREYIHRNLTDPIRLSDLCKHARTQARSLEYGFHEVLGISPVAYIRAVRLHRARALLRSPVVLSQSISQIALDSGFWHLSQFAVDYKQLFAESPSITFRRTRAAQPADRRRNGKQRPNEADARVVNANLVRERMEKIASAWPGTGD